MPTKSLSKLYADVRSYLEHSPCPFYISIILILFRETNPVRSENHMKHTDTLCGEKRRVVGC